MTETASPPRETVWLAWLVEFGLLARLLAALVAAWVAMRRGGRWLFPDTDIYWQLGQALRLGEPYEVSQWGVPHFALRVPGYPFFLAACQTLFGDRAVPVRLVQAALGAACIWVIYRLMRHLAGSGPRPRAWASPALIAAALVAVEPYTIAVSAMLLSEALFLPLMLLGLWGLATIWRPSTGESNPGAYSLKAFATGLAWGGAVLTKPSWALFPPLALGAWVVLAGRGQRGRALVGAVVVAAGLAAIMMPWWVRNQAVYGQFVPTALWSGASLRDGLSPTATGASDMSFLNDPAIRTLHEEAQDATLTARALDFARGNPRRTLELAAIKAARYWSPWPNLESVRSPWVAILSALVVVPLYVLAILGAWDQRRDPRALLILAGPVLYFAAIHMVFVSSIRYRIPGFVPALGLAAIGVCRVLEWTRGFSAKLQHETREARHD